MPKSFYENKYVSLENKCHSHQLQLVQDCKMSSLPLLVSKKKVVVIFRCWECSLMRHVSIFKGMQAPGTLVYGKQNSPHTKCETSIYSVESEVWCAITLHQIAEPIFQRHYRPSATQ
jgi:hypothetical protein